MANEAPRRPRSSSFKEWTEQLARRLSDKAPSRHNIEAEERSVNRVLDVGRTLMAPIGFRLSVEDKHVVEVFMDKLGGRNPVESASSIALGRRGSRSDSDSLTPTFVLTSDTSNDPAPLPESEEVAAEELSNEDLPDEHAFDDNFHYETEEPTIKIATGAEVQDNVVNIRTWSKSGHGLHMRALLDTGSLANIIRRGKAIETGYEMEPYQGLPVITADGGTFEPVGCVKLQWHFHNLRHERTYTIKFLIVADTLPFDVIIGFAFIRNIKLFKWNHPYAMMTHIPTSETREEKERLEKKRAAQKKKGIKKDQQYIEQIKRDPQSQQQRQSGR